MTYSYEASKDSIYCKNVALTNFIETTLNKTQQIFKYSNDNILNTKYLEYKLQTEGKCLAINYKDKIIFVSCSGQGLKDENGEYKNFVVNVPDLNINRNFNLENDKCCLLKNDYRSYGILPILKKYGVMTVDTDISLNIATVLTRISFMITAPDSRTKDSAEIYLKHIANGDMTVIADNQFLDGIKIQNTTTSNSNYISQLIELTQYNKASFLNELGLNANFNMKKERLNENEVLMNVDNLLPLIENMYYSRLENVEKLNRVFGLDLEIDFNSIWKKRHIQSKLMSVNEVETLENITEIDNIKNTDDIQKVGDINDKSE